MKKLKKGDNVMVLVGKDRGRSGAIERIDTKKGKALVLGVNIFKRHVRKTGQMEGGIIEIAKPVNLSNLALVCPNCKKTTRVGIKIGDDVKSRVCKKCGKEIK